ncbi:hypothetical protein OPT61_g8058 [Boeremia exigua]|uniref:Uncharacterized protein n=1 Tax=Boeremia exigua TaxID=749465 RepID=A0ACC2HZS1_9PLEO|nr:hypothetical protein OPT61_g8058 [Boeremia exigua]
MSLSALPTELHIQIAQYLQSTELSSVSKVSRYYRVIAEPHLYRYICIPAKQDVCARKLLLTLISRPDLATHVNGLEIEQGSHLAKRIKASFLLLENALASVQAAIASVLGSHPQHAAMRMMWQGSIMAEEFLEGTIALIACLSPGLQSLSFNVHSSAPDPASGEFISKVLSYAAVVRSSCEIVERFSKLRTLILQSRRAITVPDLPSLHFLRILDSKTVQCPTASPKLRRLELFHTNSVAIMSQLKGIPELEYLAIHDSSGRYYQPTIDKLRKECPKLNTLDLTVDRFVPWVSAPLQGLASMKNLRSLTIDLDFLVSTHDVTRLFHDSAGLPPNLVQLNIFNVGTMDFVDPKLLTSHFFAHSPRLKGLTFYVESTFVCPKSVKSVLATVTKRLRAQDIVFQVHCCIGFMNGVRVAQPVVRLMD